MTAGWPPSVVEVIAAGRGRGVDVVPREFPDGTRTAQEAAQAVGVEVGAIVKSLAFLVDGRPVMALVSGANRLDEPKLAAAAGGTEVVRASAGDVREATGFAIGGVPPFGHRADLPCYVDEDLLRWDVVWAAAGTPHHVFPLTPDDLVRASGGTVCPLA